MPTGQPYLDNSVLRLSSQVIQSASRSTKQSCLINTVTPNTTNHDHDQGPKETNEYSTGAEETLP